MVAKVISLSSVKNVIDDGSQLLTVQFSVPLSATSPAPHIVPDVNGEMAGVQQYRYFQTII